jgi:hypothetical protein
MIWYVLLLSLAGGTAIAFTFRPLLSVWNLGNSPRPCRLCRMAILCVPAFECCLGVISLAMGLGLAVTPGLMERNSSLVFDMLLSILPQPVWAAALISLALAHLLSLRFGGHWRFGATATALLFWSFLTFTTAAVPDALAPWQYGSFATLSMTSLMLISWEVGRVH